MQIIAHSARTFSTPRNRNFVGSAVRQFFRLQLSGAKLFELADTMPLAAMPPTREDKVRAFVRETINTVLTNSRPN